MYVGIHIQSKCTYTHKYSKYSKILKKWILRIFCTFLFYTPVFTNELRITYNFCHTKDLVSNKLICFEIQITAWFIVLF